MPTPSNGGDFTPSPAGTHLAICYRVLDLGTQDGTWEGKPTQKHQVMIGWELCDERMEDGRPFTVGKRYTFSSSEKATLRKDLEAWRGRAFSDAELTGGPPDGFHIRKIIGVPCLLTVIHEVGRDGRTRARISSVTKIMKGQAAPRMVNPPQYLSLAPGEFDRATFDDLPDYFRETIIKSPEFLKVTHPEGAEKPPARGDDGLDSEIPF
jgi:hypothetical protein